MQNGLIRLHQSQHTLIEQLRHFPGADHDDGPDALQMLWALATGGSGQMHGFQAMPRNQGGMGIGAALEGAVRRWRLFGNR